MWRKSRGGPRVISEQPEEKKRRIVTFDRTMKWLGAGSGGGGEPAPPMQLHYPSANGHIPTVSYYIVVIYIYIYIFTEVEDIHTPRSFLFRLSLPVYLFVFLSTFRFSNDANCERH